MPVGCGEGIKWAAFRGKSQTGIHQLIAHNEVHKPGVSINALCCTC